MIQLYETEFLRMSFSPPGFSNQHRRKVIQITKIFQNHGFKGNLRPEKIAIFDNILFESEI